MSWILSITGETPDSVILKGLWEGGCQRKSEVSAVQRHKEKKLLLQRKWINVVVVVCSRLFFPPSLLLFYYAFRLYGFTCVCVCFQSETPISNRLSHCSLLGWLRIALDLPQHLAFGLLGLYTRASVWEYVSVRGGERVCGWTAHVGGCEVVRRREDVRGYAMCIHVYRHFSVQADSGAALTTLAVQQWRVGVCLCVFFSS